MPAATKHELLRLIDEAIAGGWDHRRACRYLELGETRAWRWRERLAAGTLEDRRPGGGAVHAITPDEEDAVVRVFEEHGLTDRSHRKLAHRGSYEGVVWVSESTVRRVLAAHGLRVRAPRRAGRSERSPFPEWAQYTRHSIWIYDTTRFAGCRSTFVVMIMDLVTRKWICELVSGEETGLQVQLAFTIALELEGLLEKIDEHQTRLADPTVEDPARPVLLAVSDNGPQMTSGSTREFLAMCAIAQHFGRPGTPTDQAWIESLFSHVKVDWPHLDRIRDPAVLRAELASVRIEFRGRDGRCWPPPAQIPACASNSYGGSFVKCGAPDARRLWRAFWSVEGAAGLAGARRGVRLLCAGWLPQDRISS